MIYTAFILPFFGALVSRWHGGGFFDFPKILKSIVWALPFSMLAAFMVYDAHLKIEWAGAAFLGCLAICALGKSSGHGGFFDLGTWEKPRDDERLEFLIKHLKTKIPEYWYDAAGLAIVGIAAVLGAAIAMAFVNPIFSVILILCGAAKAPAYMIGWAVFSTNRRGRATETGEYLTGFFAYLAVPLILLIS